MCGITGFTGGGDAIRRVTKGLYALEYRGYDSAGISFFSGSAVNVVKTSGRVYMLEKKLCACGSPSSSCAIGHTRWATHGAPSETNAHPHKYGAAALVHNGIIENSGELKKAYGVRTVSETDTEVAAAVIDRNFAESGDGVEAMLRASRVFIGSYALVALFDGLPGKIYASKFKSPLLIGVSPDGYYIASDTAAMAPDTRSYIELCDGDVCEITREGYTIKNADGDTVSRAEHVISHLADELQTGIFDHHMRKEISDEPAALKKTLGRRLCGGELTFEGDGITDGELKKINGLTVVACGTAYHAGLMAKHYIERTCKIPVNVVIASEFIYGDPLIEKGDTAVFITQSGETADTLAAMNLSKERGAHTVAVVNVVGSTAARTADTVIYTDAGKEIAVASTKAYTVQCATLMALGARMAYAKGLIGQDGLKTASHALYEELAASIDDVISREAGIAAAARRYHTAENLFFIGRGADYYAGLEASLKLKEISYIHSEAYAAGELKHGTLSLVTEKTPVIALMTDARLYEKTMSSVREASARGADVFVVCPPDLARDDSVNTRFELPTCRREILPVAAATVFQLFAYHVALMRGCDIDKPRNLAKSVTVE